MFALAGQRLDPDPRGRDLPQDRARPTSPNSARHTSFSRRCSALAIAPTLFGIALLCCGMNSTVTATLAGQIVMEGFLDIKLPPWLRRLITRCHRHRSGDRRDDLVYGESGTAQAADPHAGRAESCSSLRGLPAGHVHRRQEEDGRPGRAASG
jgi:hypothetical protein